VIIAEQLGCHRRDRSVTTKAGSLAALDHCTRRLAPVCASHAIFAIAGIEAEGIARLTHEADKHAVRLAVSIYPLHPLVVRCWRGLCDERRYPCEAYVRSSG